MEKLILLSEDGVSQEFPLVEQLTSIGREEHNLICLGDKSVSRHHATLQRVFRGFTIQDEGSTNGTRVNGRPITKQFLKHRDLIEIGKYHLRFLVSEPDQQLADADKTVVIRQPEPESAPKPAPVEPFQAEEAQTEQPQSELAVAEAPPETGARVIYLEGDNKGQQLVLDRAFFSVGEPGGDLVLINKRHNGFYLLKVGGETPPTINGTPIKAGGVQLHDRDRINLGELSLEFRV
jgi:pSer/pThr/pTyr-binding forkhead associated (FHA) protein